MCNLNAFSQLLRVTIGLLLILAAWFGPQTSILPIDMKNLWFIGWIGLIPLISGIAAFCPVYAVLGRGHKPASEPEKS